MDNVHPDRLALIQRGTKRKRVTQHSGQRDATIRSLESDNYEVILLLWVSVDTNYCLEYNKQSRSKAGKEEEARGCDQRILGPPKTGREKDARRRHPRIHRRSKPGYRNRLQQDAQRSE